FDLRFDGIQPRFNLHTIQRRTQQPGTQQALSHRRNGGIEAAEQSYSSVGSGEKRFDQFEVAHRYRIEHQAVLPLVEADAVYVIERAALSGADVVEDRARRGSGRALAR